MEPRFSESLFAITHSFEDAQERRLSDSCPLPSSVPISVIVSASLADPKAPEVTTSPWKGCQDRYSGLSLFTAVAVSTSYLPSPASMLFLAIRYANHNGCGAGCFSLSF